jgi:DNA invertase Pin-like site-specific DNA recombinase
VKRVAIYIRVSTASKTKQGDGTNFVQNLEVQEQPLQELITQRGWSLFRVYSDRASGPRNGDRASTLSWPMLAVACLMWS